MDMLKLPDSISAETLCRLANGNTLVAGFSFVLISFSLLFQLIRPFFRLTKQPPIVLEIMVGLFLGNVGFMVQYLNLFSSHTFAAISEIGMSCYALVLGINFDVTLLGHTPPEAMVAYTGILSTVLVTATTAVPLIHFGFDHDIKHTANFGFIFALSLTVAGTSSPVLTQLFTEANFSRSDIGKLVTGAGIYTELTTMILLGIISFFRNNEIDNKKPYRTIIGASVSFVSTVLVLYCLYKFLPLLANWMQKNNPKGKPMRGIDVILLVGSMSSMCLFLPAILGFSQAMTSFVIGLCFPRKGRLTYVLLRTLDQLLRYFFFPIYFCWIGTNIRSYKDLKSESYKYIFVKLFFLYVIVLSGKILGALISGIILGFHWPITVAIGLFLNVKGPFHIFIATFAVENEFMGAGSFLVFLLHAILSISVIPYIMKFVIQKAKMEPTHPLMALQWFDSNSELRMLVGIHGHQNVPTTINLMEISRGSGSPCISVYLTDLIEINDKHSAVFIPEYEEDDYPLPAAAVDANVTMADESVVNMRDQITNMILAYVQKSGGGVNVHRLLAISKFSNMHQDIYNLAEAVQASLIILPYHRNQRKDGKMGNIHHGFRHVNRKVFRHPPCSVAVLVDRGFGKTLAQGSSTSMKLQVAVLFIGGKDDREALAYAARITQHPGVDLTAVRFLQDEEKAARRAKKTMSNHARALEELELNLDNEYFANFYENQVALRKVGYLERHVASGKEIVSVLKSLEEQHALFIVGRGGRVNSFLDAGIGDSEECPDLGPIGEILADSDFSTTASVLIIQQHFREEVKKDEYKILPV
ncbi:hypothetical protein MKW98_030397 [Papaver atlanticum]|uniref:Cation/H+ exchanger domain-containing protein n=1 Tax=Papaver atlanticum TaxID=357466 RepID=A0AAD4SR40_9MAGN|nr:hypothetical protein MKW98_030397 [Papaver atlanticum]